MFVLFMWVIFGLLVGSCAKLIHPGNDPIGYIPTITIGIAGSFIGGLMNWLIGTGSAAFHPSGLLMSVIGGVICCAIWRWYSLRNSNTGAKSFFTGKRLR